MPVSRGRAVGKEGASPRRKGAEMKTVLKLLLVGLAARWVINRIRERQAETPALPPTTPSVPAGTTA
jgi:hypothetical protein